MRRIAYESVAKLFSGMLIVFALAAAGTLFALPAAADDALQARHLAEKARLTLETFSQAPEMEAFRNLIKKARGVFVAPQIIKGAFIIGAAGGSGVFVARDYKTGDWVGPAFYTIGEASFGFQFGGQASEVILLAMTERGIHALLESSVKLGADVGVAAGPIGMGAAASTANFSADIISFARSKGLYGGISVDGAIVKTRSGWNSAYYGTSITPSEILIRRTVTNPASAGLIQEVSKLAGVSK
jgi:lipid-binding SYLF domain-containing protein